MVIDSNSIHTAISHKNRTDGGTPVKTNGQAKNTPQPVEKSGNGSAEVSISTKGQALSRLESEIQEAPSVDSDRVASIKKALADGSYSINAERIAEKMLQQDELFR